MFKKSDLRSGFTMVELIIVIVILGALTAIIFATMMPKATSWTAKEAVGASIGEVYSAVNNRKDGKYSAGGTFLGTTAEEVSPYMDADMTLVGTGATSYFEDIRMKEGCKYYVASDTDSDANNRRWKVLVDCSTASADKDWGTSLNIAIQDKIIKYIKDRISTAKVSHTATAITDDMSADAAGTTGTNDDAIFGIGNIK